MATSTRVLYRHLDSPGLLFRITTENAAVAERISIFVRFDNSLHHSSLVTKPIELCESSAKSPNEAIRAHRLRPESELLHWMLDVGATTDQSPPCRGAPHEAGSIRQAPQAFRLSWASYIVGLQNTPPCSGDWDASLTEATRCCIEVACCCEQLLPPASKGAICLTCTPCL